MLDGFQLPPGAAGPEGPQRREAAGQTDDRPASTRAGHEQRQGRGRRTASAWNSSGTVGAWQRWLKLQHGRGLYWLGTAFVTGTAIPLGWPGLFEAGAAGAAAQSAAVATVQTAGAEAVSAGASSGQITDAAAQASGGLLSAIPVNLNLTPLSWLWLTAGLLLPLLLLRRTHALSALLLALVIAMISCLATIDRLIVPPLGITRKATTFSATVIQAEARPNGQRMVVDDLDLYPQVRRARLTTREASPAILPGDRIRVRATLWPPSKPVVVDGYDARWLAFFAGQDAHGRIFGPLEREEHITGLGPGPPLSGRAQQAWQRLRQRIAARLSEQIPGQAGALAAALTVGERGRLNGDTTAAMREAGLAHLLAISGLHIGLVFGLMVFLLRPLVLLTVTRLPGVIGYRSNFIAALAVAGLYAALAGLSVPTVRAFAMLCFATLGLILGRRIYSLNGIALAAIFVLLLWPNSLYEPSFLLSFSVVLALITVFDSVSRWQAKRAARRFRPGVPDPGPLRRMAAFLAQYFGGVLLSSLTATLVVMPVALAIFGDIQLIGVVSNIIAVPLVAVVVMPLCVATLLLMTIGLDGLITPVLDEGLSLLILVAQRAAEADLAAWQGGLLPVWVLPLWLFALLWIAGIRGRVRWAGLAPVALCVMAIGQLQPPVLQVSDRGVVFVQPEPGGPVFTFGRRQTTGYVASVAGQSWGLETEELPGIDDMMNGQALAVGSAATEHDHQLFPEQSSPAGGSMAAKDTDNIPACTPSACVWGVIGRGREVQPPALVLPRTREAALLACRRRAEVILIPRWIRGVRCRTSRIIPLYDQYRHLPLAVHVSDEPPLFGSRVSLRRYISDEPKPWQR